MRTITVECPVPKCGWVDHVVTDWDPENPPSYIDAREKAQRAVAEHYIAKHGDETEESGPRVRQADEVVRLVEVGGRRVAAKRKIEVVSEPRPLRRRKAKSKTKRPRKTKAV